MGDEVKAIQIGRAAQSFAIIGFILPWVTVSCSGQPLATASGLSLALGSITLHNPITGAVQHQHGHPNFFVALALLTVIGGLAASAWWKSNQEKANAAALLTGAMLGVFLSIFGLVSVYDKRGQIQQDTSAVKIETRYGFWVTLLSLGVAGAFSLKAANADSGQESSNEDAALAINPNVAEADPDTAFWDSLPDKTNRDHLEEYLLRYPEGKFANLARTRLERMDRENAKAS